jgi:uncharacterized membrane protein
MNNVKYLLQELKTWTGEGIVDAETANKIASRYAHADMKSVAWSRIILGSIGALLVGLGVIALLAANWDDIPRAARAAISFMSLAACVVTYIMGVQKEWISRSFFEPLGIFWGLSIGAGISLIAQTYNISGDPESFVLTWTLLLLPVIYATRAVAPFIGYYAGLLTWASMSQFSNGITVLYWPLAILVLPALLSVRNENPRSFRTGLIIWGAALCSTAAIGVTLEKTLPGLWMIVYSGAFATLLLAGLSYESKEDPILQTPLRTIGGCGLAILLYLLIFKWPWDEIGWNHYHADIEYNPLLAYFDYFLACVLPILAGFMLLVANRKMPATTWKGIPLVSIWTAWGIAPVVVAGAYIAASTLEEAFLASMIITIYLAGLGLCTLAEGLIRRSMLLVNAGILILISIILGKFFCSDLSFTTKGIAFIVSGSLFFLVNSYVGRYLRKEENT